jgi:hypothetical protein
MLNCRCRQFFQKLVISELWHEGPNFSSKLRELVMATYRPGLLQDRLFLKSR